VKRCQKVVILALKEFYQGEIVREKEEWRKCENVGKQNWDGEIG
jgi:hypothetical protein